MYSQIDRDKLWKIENFDLQSHEYLIHEQIQPSGEKSQKNRKGKHSPLIDGSHVMTKKKKKVTEMKAEERTDSLQWIYVFWNRVMWFLKILLICFMKNMKSCELRFLIPLQW